MAALRHLDDYFETPWWLIDEIKESTGLVLDLDICASDSNCKCTAFIDEEMDVLKRTAESFKYHEPRDAIFCNPPRSKNGKFVNFVYNTLWQECNLNIIMLLCWNDLGNKYGEKLLPHILNNEIEVHNLGKVKFDKDNKESEYPSRLTYFWAWFKSNNI